MIRDEQSGTTFKYDPGSEQLFNEVTNVLYPSQLIGEGYAPADGLTTIPLAILMETDCECVLPTPAFTLSSVFLQLQKSSTKLSSHCVPLIDLVRITSPSRLLSRSCW